jgi:hypothetical protein
LLRSSRAIRAQIATEVKARVEMNQEQE